MKILSFGSLNIDNVYHVSRIVRPDETIASTKTETNCGGKGLNQSIALSKAGMEVFHAGKTGEDGQILIEALEEAGVNTDLICKAQGKSGHTVIQVDEMGQNSIVLCGGTNRTITEADVDAVMKRFEDGSLLILQNEISSLDYLMKRAKEKKMKIVLNPSPMDAVLSKMDLSSVELFILNEIEGEQITGKNAADEILDGLSEKYPNASFVLTLGKEGSVFRRQGEMYRQSAMKVEAVDTTAAGDTFTGYFIREYYETGNPQSALAMAAAASAIAVSRQGAAKSIPLREEVLEWRARNAAR